MTLLDLLLWRWERTRPKREATATGAQRIAAQCSATREMNDNHFSLPPSLPPSALLQSPPSVRPSVRPSASSRCASQQASASPSAARTSAGEFVSYLPFPDPTRSLSPSVPIYNLLGRGILLPLLRRSTIDSGSCAFRLSWHNFNSICGHPLFQCLRFPQSALACSIF